MRKRLLPLGLILLLAGLVAPVLRDLVREVLVLPLLYILWIGRLIVDTIPQLILWGGVLTIFLIIMIISLLETKKSRQATRKAAKEPQERIKGWADLIHKAAWDDYFKWRLAQHLQKLTLDAIAHDRGQSPKQIKQQLRRGELDIPPELQAYFQASLTSLGQLAGPKRLFQPKAPPSPLDLDLAKVVEFLENMGIGSTTQIWRETHEQ
jgi:hypothetical protein